ncbi:MAG TPA: aromatic amino acid ammonia-lyase [Pilimelia sp.]|nr:aromatic amino acid ammonia-lyase [Pilimelia sp.]
MTDPLAVLARASGRIEASPAELRAMARSRAVLTGTATEVYGLTRGFGPLAGYPADPDPRRHGLGLISHLAVGQGEPLPPAVTRTAVWLRLRSMALGHSAVDPDLWHALAAQWNAGFTPVVPREGSLSASGDLVPLAHAALAAGGSATERAWQDGAQVHPAHRLRALGVPPVVWEARTALAFVNGSSASLAQALHNHRELAAAVRLAADTTARIVRLLGCDPTPYGEPVSRVRNQPGQRTVAGWIRSALPAGHTRAADRPLQERYSLRCAPQVLGAVLDQLAAQGAVLAREAAGCTDNPVVVDGAVQHGGNFHAAPVALATEAHAGCVHQVAMLLERQLALLVDPAGNGGLPPMLTPTPGAASGLAGVQIAAASHLARLRQLAHPASTTTMPANLDNQDHTPLALNGANAVADMLLRLRWIAGSLLVAVTQHAHLRPVPADGLWAGLRDLVDPVTVDRPLAATIRAAAALALPAAG